MQPPIEDYALIGDLETAALVSRGGSIDWLCWPRFDSAACFARLLGSPDHGRWLIGPRDPEPRVTRRYRPHSLILETDFETDEGAVTLIDFMPLRGTASDPVRIVVGRRGRVSLHTELVIRFGYGADVPWATRLDDTRLHAVAGPDRVLLKTQVPLRQQDSNISGEFAVGEGETAAFVLCHCPSHLGVPIPVDPFAALEETERFWRDWCTRCSCSGNWREAFMRSLITLKALTYAPTGGIVAAPTTSLPEWIGGQRNWDYRYCWLRDATLTLLALMKAGYQEEAISWHDWLLRAVAGSPSQIQIMYGIAGERRLPEGTLDWLPGYRESRPVRIGNAAAPQLQIDVFGEVMDALHQARHFGLDAGADGWALQQALVEHLETVWQKPDEGIWEVRGGRQHFTHSKVMAWVALDRTIRSAERFGLPGPISSWRELRMQIHREVCERGFNPEIGAFVQSYGSDTLDASLLLLPLVGFLPAQDPRVKATVTAIEHELTIDGFVRRYHTSETQDGLPPGEGAFVACSFWLVDNFLLQGRIDDARQLFERLLAISNDVGLLAEEYDPRAGRQLGNFPQAFSHLALVGTALRFEKVLAGQARQSASSSSR